MRFPPFLVQIIPRSPPRSSLSVAILSYLHTSSAVCLFLFQVVGARNFHLHTATFASKVDWEGTNLVFLDLDYSQHEVVHFDLGAAVGRKLH